MTMTLTQGPSMNSFKNADSIDGSTHRHSLPTSYAAIIDEHGVEVEITDAQILCALDAMDVEQQFPYGSSSTACGRWTAKKAPARKLHS